MNDETQRSAWSLDGKFPLALNVYVDFNEYVIYVNKHSSTLTAREVTILRILVSSPRRYYSASQLATMITSSYAEYGVSDHSIEQTISNLRRKLGEKGKTAQLIRCRRELGYALFPLVDEMNKI